jgi:hypothetical protein
MFLDFVPDEFVDGGHGEQFATADAFDEDEAGKRGGDFKVGCFRALQVRERFVSVLNVAARSDEAHGDFGRNVQDDVEFRARDTERAVLQRVVPGKERASIFGSVKF